MPRTDKSVTILTGMIIAALYVVLLVGFSRESYMRRDAEQVAGAINGWSVVNDASNSICRIDRPVCPPLASTWADGRLSQSTPSPAYRLSGSARLIDLAPKSSVVQSPAPQAERR